MADRTFKPKRGEEIVITVPRAKQPAGTSFPSSIRRGKGIINLREADEFLPRRLKKGGFINFYDLGHLLNPETGVYEDVPYLISPPVLDYFVWEEPRRVIGFFVDSMMAQLETLIFNVPIADWKTRFKRITRENGVKYQYGLRGGQANQDIDDFSFGLKVTETEWTTEGLKLTTEQLSAERITLTSYYDNAIFNPNVFNGFQLKSYLRNGVLQRRNHITATYNPFAVAAVFNPSSSMDVFLLPHVFLSRGIAASPAGNQAEITETVLNYNYTIYPREVILNPLSPFYGEGFGIEQYRDSSRVTLEEAMLGVNFHKSLPQPRVFSHETEHNNQDPPSSAQRGLSDFPPSNYFNFATVFRSHIFEFGNSRLENPYLLAVIGQNGSYFYVWSNRSI